VDDEGSLSLKEYKEILSTARTEVSEEKLMSIFDPKYFKYQAHR